MHEKTNAQIGSNCSQAFTITPTSLPTTQSFTLASGAISWFKFNISSAIDIDIIESFHSDLSQEIAQIETFSSAGNCNTLSALTSIQLVTLPFLKSHQIVTINPTDFVKITWSKANAPINIIFQIYSSTNDCMLNPNETVDNTKFLASVLFPSNNLGNPFTGKILVKAQTIFIIDKEICFDNCEFVMEYGSAIKLQSYQPTAILSRIVKFNNCHIHGCDKMWEGISSSDGSENNLYFENSVLEDAYIGITPIGCDLPCASLFPMGSEYTIRNSVFNHNLIGIWIGGIGASAFQSIENTIFTSRDISYLGGYPTVAQLKLTNEDLLINHSPFSGLKAPCESILRSYCGIYQFSDAGNKIFGGGTIDEYNLFDKLAFGIINDNSSASIYNSHFQNMEFRRGLTPFYIPDEMKKFNILANEGVGIASQGRGADFTLTVGTPVSYKKCLFKNCASAGIRTIGYRQIDIIGNRFTHDGTMTLPLSGNMGIHILKPSYINGIAVDPHLNLNICANHLTNIAQGIGIYLSVPKYKFDIFHVDYNIIDGTPGTGITMQGINSRLNTTQSNPNRTINNNTILNTRNGINLGSFLVDYIVPFTKRLTVGFNTISLSSFHTIDAASVGIHLTSCKVVDVLNNYDIFGFYTGASTLQSPFETAYINTLSNYCTVSCNSAHHVERAFVFEQRCDPTNFTNNYMSNCYDGVVLRANGIIGPQQGFDQKPSDNYWNPASGSFGHMWTFAEKSQGSLSPFIVRNQSGYIPPPLLNSNTFGSNFSFAFATGPYLQCNTLNNSPVYNANGTVERLLNDSTYTDVPPESIYLKDRMIYDRMSHDSLFADTASQVLIDYYDSLSYENVGRISETEDLVQSRDYLQAQLLAEAIIPSNIAEDITIRFIVIYCNWLLDSIYVFTQDEKEQLQLMAAMCPALYGDAVTMARTLLKTALDDYTEYADNCNENGTNSRKVNFTKKEITKKILVESSFQIRPNPSKGIIELISPINDGAFYFELEDLQGRVVYKNEYTTSVSSVDLSNLNSGLYFYKIKYNIRLVKKGKLILAK